MIKSELLIFILVILVFNLQCASRYDEYADVKKLNFEQQSPISYCGLEGFTKADPEHIVREINKPFEVCKIKGKIVSEAGDWPKGTDIIFEIRKTDKKSKIIRIKTDESGILKMRKVEDGVYCFKVTVNGWQSVIGIIIVIQEADPKNEITIEMLLGV
jgi:hypothetical protein